jgi:TIGR03009 family protein
MMRLTWATLVAILISAPTIAQQADSVPSYAKPQPAQKAAKGTAPATRVATNTKPVPAAQPQQPFPPLSAAAKAQLQELLLSWQQQSQGTKTLECSFARWHFDMFAAPAGIHATRADGVIKYAAPDKGLFRVDRLVFFGGMENGKPQYKEQPGQYGEHWVCNGTQLIEFDRSKEECRIQDLPPEMQGQKIFNSPLPFVFNLDAQQIQLRYWVRQVDPPRPEIVLVEAWPKRQEDRAQYKLVQIALDASTFLPQALIMYAPNFDPKTAPKWDHYEFTDVKRNAISAGFQKFLGNFIPQKPPANWKILRDKFAPPVDLPVQQAAAPDDQPVR